MRLGSPNKPAGQDQEQALFALLLGAHAMAGVQLKRLCRRPLLGGRVACSGEGDKPRTKGQNLEPIAVARDRWPHHGGGSRGRTSSPGLQSRRRGSPTLTGLLAATVPS